MQCQKITISNLKAGVQLNALVQNIAGINVTVQYTVMD